MHILFDRRFRHNFIMLFTDYGDTFIEINLFPTTHDQRSEGPFHFCFQSLDWRQLPRLSPDNSRPFDHAISSSRISIANIYHAAHLHRRYRRPAIHLWRNIIYKHMITNIRWQNAKIKEYRRVINCLWLGVKRTWRAHRATHLLID